MNRRDHKMTTFIKSYKDQKVVESYYQPSPEGTGHIVENILYKAFTFIESYVKICINVLS